jgi:hypothetical protein
MTARQAVVIRCSFPRDAPETLLPHRSPTLGTTKEAVMRDIVFRGILFRLRHELGTGRALDNARAEREVLARAELQLAALERRYRVQPVPVAA